MGTYVVSQVSICNRALQLLGAPPIQTIGDNTPAAHQMNRAYNPVLYALLEEYHFNFAIKRIQIAASLTPPVFGPANYFPLPADFIDLVPNDTDYKPILGPSDWQVEGNQIVSYDAGPINLRYMSSNVTEGQFDPVFAEAFSASLAMNCCEAITQSNSKLAAAAQAFDMAMRRAKQRNAYQKKPQDQPMSPWLYMRI